MSFSNQPLNPSDRPPIPSGDLIHRLTIQEDTEEFKPKTLSKSPKKQPEYFSHDQTIDYNSFSDIPDNDDYFNLKNFFVLASIHGLYYYLLGPLSLIFIIPIFGKPVAHNLYFTSCHLKSLWNFLQYVLFIIVPTIFLTYSPKNVLNIEVFMFMGGYMMLKSLDCVTFSTMGPNKLKFFFSHYLSPKELEAESTYSHFDSEKIDAFIEEEILATMERKDIDLSLFKITFFSNLDPKIEQEVNGLVNLRHINAKRVNQQTTAFFPKSYPTYNGSNIAKLLIKLAYKSWVSPKVLKLFAIFLAIVYAFVPMIIRAYLGQPIIGLDSLEKTMILGLFFLNIYYYYKDAILAIFSLYEYYTYSCLMTQLTNLLAYKRDLKYESKKFFPTMDFFNPLTIKSWGILHTIFKDYGKKYKIRINCYLSLYMFANFLAGIFLIFSFYGMSELFDWFKVIIVIYEFMVFAILGFLILLKAAAINDHFNIHRIYINNNMDIIGDLNNQYLFYFEEDEIAVENEIFREGVMRIKTYSEEIYENQKQKHPEIERKNKEEILKEIRIDSMAKLSKLMKLNTKQLQYELEIEPLTVLGVTVTTALVNSLVIALGSFILASIQGVCQKYYG